MDSRHYFQDTRISPKKIRFFLPVIKKMNPVDALDYLYYTPNKTGRILHKMISSAIASAKQSLKADEHLLKFKTLAVDEGHTIKRQRAGGRGTAKPIMRRSSHVLIILTVPSQLGKEKTVVVEKPVVEVKKKKTLPVAKKAVK